MREKVRSEDLLDGCGLDFREAPLPAADTDLYVLFAEAVDESTAKTIEEARSDWEELLK